MATLRPIRNHIVFQFEEDEATHRGVTHFQEKTEWGFEFSDSDVTLELGRWVNVTHVGPEVTDNIKPGMRVCVDHLKWTHGFEFEGEKYWRTDSDNILLIDESVQAA